MPRGNGKNSDRANGATVGYEAELWGMADARRGSMDAAEYKHVVLARSLRYRCSQVAAVSLFPTLIGAMLAWSLLPVFWWGGALWAGASMVAIAPTHGMAACVTLAALGEAVLLAVWAVGVQIDAVNVTTGTFYMTAVARARVIAWTQQHAGAAVMTRC